MSHIPSNAGLRAPYKILVKHYQFRSPEQIQKRLDIRNELKKRGEFWAMKEEKVEDVLLNRQQCVYDDGKLETYKKIPLIHKDSLKRRILFWIQNTLHLRKN